MTRLTNSSSTTGCCSVDKNKRNYGQQHKTRTRSPHDDAVLMFVLLLFTTNPFVGAFNFPRTSYRTQSIRIYNSNLFGYPIRYVGYRLIGSTAVSNKRKRIRLYGAFPTGGAVNPSNPSYGLLYKEQEKLLIKRGEIEEELMKNNYAPLLANPIPDHLIKSKSAPTTSVGRTGASGSGFGGGVSATSKKTKGSKNKANDKQQQVALTTTTNQKELINFFPSAYLKEAELYADVLQKQGVVRIDNVLDEALADELRDFVMKLRQDSFEKAIKQQIVPSLDRFANVLLRTNRCDLKIPLLGTGSEGKNRSRSSSIDRILLQDRYKLHVDNTNIVEKALYQVITQSAIPDTIQLLFNKYTGGTASSALSPVLYELSSLISDPGSERQNIHPDNPICEGQNDVPVLLTCFIALQDVQDDMGPTIWLPGTHTAEYHDIFFQDQPIVVTDGTTSISPKDHLLQTHPAVRGTLKRGCCAIYDSRILHCGSANRRFYATGENDLGLIDANSRAIFYFSFRNPLVAYPGNPASIRPEIGQSKITLQEFQNSIYNAVALHSAGSSDRSTVNPFPWNR